MNYDCYDLFWLRSWFGCKCNYEIYLIACYGLDDWIMKVVNDKWSKWFNGVVLDVLNKRVLVKVI